MFEALKDKLKGKPRTKRSPHWRVIRAVHLIKNPFCALCHSQKNLEVHHIMPVHVEPSLELEESNLITLCESGKGGIVCHLAIGHQGNYKNVNPDVRQHILAVRKILGKE